MMKLTVLTVVAVMSSCLFASSAVALSIAPVVTATVATGSGVDDGRWLQQLYNATNGSGWKCSAGWTTTAGANPCNGNVSRWSAVLCNNQGRVYRVYLGECNLRGTLPELDSSTGAMSQLEVMTLYGNHLFGTLPASWSNFSSLLMIFASSNKLSSTLPESWSSLSSLQVIDLTDNNLKGTLPASWGNLSNLSQIILSKNQLSGTLPSQWATFTRNNFPNALIRMLYLRNNSFSGPFPSSWVMNPSVPPDYLAMELDGNCLNVSSIPSAEVNWWKAVAGSTYTKQRAHCEAL